MTNYIDTFTQSLGSYVPGIVAAIVLLLLAWIVGSIIRAVVVRLGTAFKLDTKLNSPGMSKTAGQICFWLVWLLFLPGILSALRLETVLVPIQGMLNRLLGFIPNVIGTVLVLVVGWFVAKLLGNLCAQLLHSIGADKLGQRLGLEGTTSLSRILGVVVYVFILIPVVTAALNSLNLTYVTAPLSGMLNSFLAAIPNILAAAVLLLISVFVARVVRETVAGVATAAGFNRLPVRLGLRSSTAVASATSPSRVLGNVIFAVIVLFASMEAAHLLQFVFLAELINHLLVFAGQIALGLVIFAFGLFLAKIAEGAIASSGMQNAGAFIVVARSAILFVVSAMALAEMGLARDIVNLAFGLLLGALAVAGALAFGLGGRQTAARILERWDNDYSGKHRLLDLHPTEPSHAEAGV